MRRATKWSLLGIGIVLLLVVGFVVAERYFFPEKATRVNEAAPQGTQVLKMGSFEGKAGHHVSGTVKLLRVDDVYYLRFENYEQTQGPDVFVYLTPSDSPDSKNEIQQGIKVLIDGGADGGESTKTGNFNQRLPDDFQPDVYHGVGIWCENFSVPFGAASLASP